MKITIKNNNRQHQITGLQNLTKGIWKDVKNPHYYVIVGDTLPTYNTNGRMWENALCMDITAIDALPFHLTDQFEENCLYEKCPEGTQIVIEN